MNILAPGKRVEIGRVHEIAIEGLSLLPKGFALFASPFLFELVGASVQIFVFALIIVENIKIRVIVVILMTHIKIIRDGKNRNQASVMRSISCSITVRNIFSLDSRLTYSFFRV